MTKFLEKRFDADRLQIKSVIAPEHLKGYVYIEAEKESHVVHVFHSSLFLFIFYLGN